jgi:hypothetical protein
MIDKDVFISIGVLSSYFKLPESYLRGLADRGTIPFLCVNGRRRFNPAAVEKALTRLQRVGRRKRKPTILGRVKDA